MFSFCTVAKNPNRPALIPNIGIPESLTKVAALKIVPSPPILTKISKLESKSLKLEKVRYSFFTIFFS